MSLLWYVSYKKKHQKAWWIGQAVGWNLCKKTNLFWTCHLPTHQHLKVHLGEEGVILRRQGCEEILLIYPPGNESIPHLQKGKSSSKVYVDINFKPGCLDWKFIHINVSTNTTAHVNRHFHAQFLHVKLWNHSNCISTSSTSFWSIENFTETLSQEPSFGSSNSSQNFPEIMMDRSCPWPVQYGELPSVWLARAPSLPFDKPCLSLLVPINDGNSCYENQYLLC